MKIKINQICFLNFSFVFFILISGCQAPLPRNKEVIKESSSFNLKLSETYSSINGYSWGNTDNSLLLSIVGKNQDQQLIKTSVPGMKIDWVVDTKSEGPVGNIMLSSKNVIYRSNLYSAQMKTFSVVDGTILAEFSSTTCDPGHWLFYNEMKDIVVSISSVPSRSNLETIVNIWDLQSGNCQIVKKIRGFSDVVDFHSTTGIVLFNILRGDSPFVLWDSEEKMQMCPNIHGEFAKFVGSSNLLAVALDNTVSLYDLRSCALIDLIETDDFYRGYFAVSSDGKVLATAGKSLQLWDTNSGKILHEKLLTDNFSSQTHRPIFSFNFDNDLLLAVFASQDSNNEKQSTMTLWEISQ